MKNTYNFIARHYCESPEKCKEYYTEHEQACTNKKEMIKTARKAAAKIRSAINMNVKIYVQVFKNGKYSEELIIK